MHSVAQCEQRKDERRTEGYLPRLGLGTERQEHAGAINYFSTNNFISWN